MKDPLYDWLEEEVQIVFEFLVANHSFVLSKSASNKNGCWLTYMRNGIGIEIWTEMGGRPEVDINEDGQRRSLNLFIAKHCPEFKPSFRPPYTGQEGERGDFKDVLQKYASALQKYLQGQSSDR